MNREDGFWWLAGTRRSRRSLLRGACTAGAGLAGTALLGCSSRPKSTSGSAPGSGARAAPQRGGVLNTTVDKGPDTWDPHKSIAIQTGTPLSFAASRLFRFRTGRDPKAKEEVDLEGDLALSAESPDAVTWTIKLRQGAKFHDTAPVSGHPVQAEDIKATFVRALAPDSATRAALSMIDPSQIQTPAADTVVFKLRNPYAEFPNQVASPKFGWILPREALAGSYDVAKQPIGSGPFVFNHYTPDVEISFTRNSSYYESGLPYVDGARTAIIPDLALQRAQFTAGNLDTIGSIKRDDLDAMRSANPKAPVIRQGGGNAVFVWFPLGVPNSPFRDVRVRRAVSMAIDRDAMVKVIWGGEGEWQYQVPFKMGKWALKSNELAPDDLQHYKYNLAEAKRLLEAAGGASLNVQLWFFLPHAPEYTKSAETVYSMLSQLPWKITLVQKDYVKDWLGSGKGVRYGSLPAEAIAVNGSDALTNVDDFVYGYFYSTSPTSIVRVKDPELDTMLDGARALVNDDGRLKAYKDVQRYIASRVYADGLPFGYNYTLNQPWNQNSVSNAVDMVATGTRAAGLWLSKN
jgi:peptide/nickel transport system substrate-binding protein